MKKEITSKEVIEWAGRGGRWGVPGGRGVRPRRLRLLSSAFPLANTQGCSPLTSWALSLLSLESQWMNYLHCRMLITCQTTQFLLGCIHYLDERFPRYCSNSLFWLASVGRPRAASGGLGRPRDIKACLTS